ncbi:CMP-N-acetylneuraminate-beta-galactosamide-alpha-2,3-sialyltransferase 2-like [Cheilinus undulatus]|uniref:CMP-N-acetylneuraminate-beta-galactosamide- alpha-2,3-sialyltransferase 2-like n=1 Tax=Cheilinus undulatus TaxID=241271 RepID=UPI001BD52D6F|nr:CMP-N-acetylneuraminate-beta-galactosamide-alpha-2,3-sialyltransferase 2-like [Cheilinus undulatus]
MFRAAVDAAPVPFLSKDFSMSSDDFKRWKRMQSEQRNMTVFKMVVDKLFQIIPPVPQYEEVSPKRCNTCAVVGNSGNLKGSHYGDLIDSHDIVIRMNRGHTKGYEEDVGTKTTHHVMYPESATNLANTTRLVFFAFKINDLEWLLRTMTPENKNSPKRANKDLVMIINPAFMIYAHKVWLQSKGHYPSTGFFTVILSLQMCDVVNVFGFGADRAGNWNHYFEKAVEGRGTQGHGCEGESKRA